MATSFRQIRSNQLAANFRFALEMAEVAAHVRAARDGIGVRVSTASKFSEAEQRSIIQAAALMGLHHCAPEFGGWPVKADDRGHPDYFSFWSN